jgi:hypothetical protein
VPWPLPASSSRRWLREGNSRTHADDATGKIGEIRKRLTSIRSAIESGKTGDACAQIEILQGQAPRLLKGTDAREMLNRISALRGQLGCRDCTFGQCLTRS